MRDMTDCACDLGNMPCEVCQDYCNLCGTELPPIDGERAGGECLCNLCRALAKGGAGPKPTREIMIESQRYK